MFFGIFWLNPVERVNKTLGSHSHTCSQLTSVFNTVVLLLLLCVQYCCRTKVYSYTSISHWAERSGLIFTSSEYNGWESQGHDSRINPAIYKGLGLLSSNLFIQHYYVCAVRTWTNWIRMDAKRRLRFTDGWSGLMNIMHNLVSAPWNTFFKVLINNPMWK